MRANEGEIILYSTEDGEVELEIKLDHENQTIWLTQNQMAELFTVSVKTVNEHLKNIYEEIELREKATIRNFRIVRQEGSREVEREINHYNLKAILAVGYRVRSERGTQFRRWATDHLNDYLVKGFVMNDKRLKEPGGWDYFDELLERIKDIRASEKRFYQKVRDLVKETSVDYSKDHPKTKEFFSSIQNKLLFAETGKTAAELIIERADSNKPNMGLTSFDGKVVRKKEKRAFAR
ncbi:MAG: RhuM family protein [Bacteriovoracaceae bacterium]